MKKIYFTVVVILGLSYNICAQSTHKSIKYIRFLKSVHSTNDFYNGDTLYAKEFSKGLILEKSNGNADKLFYDQKHPDPCSYHYADGNTIIDLVNIKDSAWRIGPSIVIVLNKLNIKLQKRINTRHYSCSHYSSITK